MNLVNLERFSYDLFSLLPDNLVYIFPNNFLFQFLVLFFAQGLNAELISNVLSVVFEAMASDNSR